MTSFNIVLSYLKRIRIATKKKTGETFKLDVISHNEILLRKNQRLWVISCKQEVLSYEFCTVSHFSAEWFIWKHTSQIYEKHTRHANDLDTAEWAQNGCDSIPTLTPSLFTIWFWCLLYNGVYFPSFGEAGVAQRCPLDK